MRSWVAGTLALSATIGLAGLAVPAEAKAAAKPYDFNGDGRRDLAIGSPGGRVGKASGAGFVSVVYGSASGIGGARKVIGQNSAGVPGAAEAGDRFGSSLASADFNRDGYADLAVGAPGENAGTGSVTILWGSRSGLAKASVHTEARAAKGHRFGESLAAGDIQGDGSPELFVTVPGTSTYTWLYFGGARAKAMDAPARIRSARDVDQSWVAAGDVNGDGRGDVAYGWFDHDDPEVDHRRGFTVFYGTSGGGFTRGTTVYKAVFSLAIADFDGDRRGDVAAGDIYDSPWVGGSVRVYRGSPFGLSGSYDIHQGTPGVPGIGRVEDDFGYALAAGDVNGDGRADLAVGAPKSDVGGAFDAGTAFLLLGSPSGLTGRGAQEFSQASRGVPGTAVAHEHFGLQVSLLDHDRDGRADLVSGAPDEDRGDGGVTFLRGGASGLVARGASALSATTLGVRGRAAHVGGRLGR
ncbi:FG-GAP repeat protein [Actinomadura macrotermitis]|uniref:VCBS repeat-containing protein n=1 Tax=Actinomadura macrotermitis TaxID=2585200 RepID=A0A7K0BVN3_9ACTN|nr:hypothetical protein [Actinomadura macrotermitis]